MTPGNKRGGSNTGDMKIGQDQSRAMPSTGSVDHGMFADEFETVDTPNYEDVMKQVAFFNEKVEVMVSLDQRPNAEQYIQTSVDGVNQFFERGVPVWVKRCYVEVLARARPFSLSTPEYTDANGNRATKINKSFGLAYPFSVLTDPNPDGRRWLESVLREG